MMNILTKFLVETLLGEEISDKIVVYSGRFQPFHKGHFATYQSLVKKFGKENVYIGTSNKTDNVKSPFGFKEKKYIINKMFGIPTNKIIQIKNPYAPVEILDKFDSKTTAFITAVGEKDELRLGGKYFEKYTDSKDLEAYMDKGYVYISPSQPNAISGTDVRNWLGKGTEEERKKGFMKAYPKFDEKIFKLITLTLNKITKENLIETSLGGYSADEGEPAPMYIPDGQKRILNKQKPEPWFKQLGYTQMDKPKADNMRGKGKSKDTDSQFRKVYYKVSNINVSDLKPVEKPKGVAGWKKIKEDTIPGGLAKGKTLIDLAKKWDEKGYYDPKQYAKEYIKPKLIKGIKVEMEHTTDVRIATEIAMDHLWEDINYYEKLSKIEIVEITAWDAFPHDGNTTTGYIWNSDWDDYDNQDYYLYGLEGWNLYDSEPSKNFRKMLKGVTLPIDNHSDENGNYYEDNHSYITPEEFFGLSEAYTKGQLFAGKIKIGGHPVDVEVELVGADNKINAFLTKVINIDKKYWSKLPIGSPLPIPARIFRTPGGGWRKIKTPSVFETISSKTHPAETDAEKNFLQHHKTSTYAPDYGHHPELDTIDFDDTRKKEPGHQVGGKDTENRGYEPVKESILLEGGAYGHMNHPFDIEMNLTFADLKRIVKQALSGKLELAREKTDGQALAVSWVNGRLVAARNKSHLKNKGRDAMNVQDVISKFAGRGSVSDAFSFAIKDLESAIKGLPETNKKKIFKDGKCFMNCEIIYPENTNVIPYGQSLLVFHGTMEYNEEGNAIGENPESGAQLAAMVKKVNADVQSKFKLQGPPVQKLPVNKDLKAKQPIFLSKIQALQSEFGLSDKSGVADYHQAWWMDFVNKNTTGLDQQQKIGLVKRWAFGDKAFRIKDIKDEKNRMWAEKIEKQDQQKITKDNLLKFETIFLGVGAEVLSFMTSVLTVNPDAAKQQMVSRLQTAIDSIKATGDAKNLDKLNIELSRIEALGGFDKIVPNEGIVFNYKGNTFKLTGAFAPLNQILGIFTFSR
jgi:hypothetical protein